MSIKIKYKIKKRSNKKAQFIHRVHQIPFLFLENALKTTAYILKFFYYLKVQSFRLIMENNFIPMAASAGHAVAYTMSLTAPHKQAN